MTLVVSGCGSTGLSPVSALLGGMPAIALGRAGDLGRISHFPPPIERLAGDPGETLFSFCVRMAMRTAATSLGIVDRWKQTACTCPHVFPNPHATSLHQSVLTAKIAGGGVQSCSGSPFADILLFPWIESIWWVQSPRIHRRETTASWSNLPALGKSLADVFGIGKRITGLSTVLTALFARRASSNSRCTVR